MSAGEFPDRHDQQGEDERHDEVVEAEQDEGGHDRLGGEAERWQRHQKVASKAPAAPGAWVANPRSIAEQKMTATATKGAGGAFGMAMSST